KTVTTLVTQKVCTHLAIPNQRRRPQNGGGGARLGLFAGREP
ncbi:hypothetical protein CSUI_009145, partial [Cystoisospora suis]